MRSACNTTYTEAMSQCAQGVCGLHVKLHLAIIIMCFFCSFLHSLRTNMAKTVLIMSVLILILINSVHVHSAIPNHWINYFKQLETFFKANPLSCLPQTILPNEFLLTQNDQGISYLPFVHFLSPVIIWNPLKQFPTLFSTTGISCSKCKWLMHEGQWNTGCHAYDHPRILHDMNSIVVLIGVSYRCPNSHKMLSYDPQLLSLVSKKYTVPFVLSHKTGFTQKMMQTVLGMIEQGSEFTSVISLIRQCRKNCYNDMLRHLHLLTSTCSQSDTPAQLTAKIDCHEHTIKVFPYLYFLATVSCSQRTFNGQLYAVINLQSNNNF